MKAEVVQKKRDRNAINLTWLYEERNKNGERLESKKKKKETKRQLMNKIPTIGNGVGALSLEIRTGNCSKLPCRHTYNHLAVLGRLNQNDKSVLSQCQCGAVVCDTSV